MNEADTRADHIDPALAAAGWGVVEGSRIRREYLIAPGRIEGQGRRGKARGSKLKTTVVEPCQLGHDQGNPSHKTTSQWLPRSRLPASGRVKKCLDAVAHSQDTSLNILWYDITTQPLCSRVWTS